MKLPEMKTGLVISALLHLALLAWGLVSFAVRPLEAAARVGLPVDIISDKQFSELTNGSKNGAKDKIGALVEKVGETKPVDDPKAKPNEKKEIDATKDVVPPPPPPPEAKPDPKQAKKEPPKPDVIAETLKKEEAKKKKIEPPKPVLQFDPTKIAALLDKRPPERRVASGDTLVPVAGLGAPNATAAKLSQSEIDALMKRLGQAWNVPAGVTNPDEVRVTVVIQIGRDRRLSGPPRVVSSGGSPMYMAARDSAMRAILFSQPFDMLRPDHYDIWKEIEITFDPRTMNGG